MGRACPTTGSSIPHSVVIDTSWCWCGLRAWVRFGVAGLWPCPRVTPRFFRNLFHSKPLQGCTNVHCCSCDTLFCPSYCIATSTMVNSIIADYRRSQNFFNCLCLASGIMLHASCVAGLRSDVCDIDARTCERLRRTWAVSARYHLRFSLSHLEMDVHISIMQLLVAVFMILGLSHMIGMI